MVCAKTTVLHESGLHMRPAQEFVSAVANYPCKVIIKVGEKSVNGKSILSVMAAGIKRDTPIEICCDGPEEQQAFLKQIRSYAGYDTGVEVVETDRVVTLSTCVSSRRDYRYIVHGKLTEEIAY